MSKEIRYRFDESDDIAEMIDAVLSAPGIRIRYKKEGPDNWISMIGDSRMEDGIRQLPEIEQVIIEKFFLQMKTPIDIARDLNLPIDMLIGHLIAIRARLECHV